MYGIVNRATEDLIRTKYGRETWTAVGELLPRSSAIHFDVLEDYPAELTLECISAASEVLRISPKEMMQQVGQHLIAYVDQLGYGEIFNMAGTTFDEFLDAVDIVLANTMSMMPNLEATNIEIDRLSNHELEIRCYGLQPEFGPLALGLLQGIAARYDAQVRVAHHLPEPDRGVPTDYQRFAVQQEATEAVGGHQEDGSVLQIR